MKTERGFRLWVWVVGPIAVIIAAVILLALLREAGSSDPEADIALEDIAEEPSQFFGEAVTVSGDVWEVLGPRSFLITERLTGDLLVISPVPLREAGDQPGGHPLTEEDLVRVTGEVRKFDIASAEQKIGAGLEADALDTYVGAPAIIADSVSLKPPTAGDRDRDSV